MVCEAVTSDLYARIQRSQRGNPGYNRKCIRQARWKVFGRCLCSVHAGQDALQRMRRQGIAKRILKTGAT